MAKPDKNITMICLPYAGGNRFSYNIYNTYLSGTVSLYTADYPGHTTRMNEPLLYDMHQIVADVYGQICEQLAEPYVIWGHSMGALAGYLLTKKIIEQKKTPPMHLFVSGAQPPSVKDVKPARHVMPQQEFFEELRSLGGMQEQILQNSQLMSFLEPVLRADFQALHVYEYQKTKPFDVPLTVMMERNSGFSAEDISKWQEETIHKTTFLYFEGGHFFIFEYPRLIVAEISSVLKNIQVNTGCRQGAACPSSTFIVS